MNDLINQLGKDMYGFINFIPFIYIIQRGKWKNGYGLIYKFLSINLFFMTQSLESWKHLPNSPLGKTTCTQTISNRSKERNKSEIIQKIIIDKKIKQNKSYIWWKGRQVLTHI